MTLREWAKSVLEIWPNAAQRMQVAGEYATMRQFQHALADLGIRNHVFGAGPDVDNLFEAGIAEGRRRAVLELYKLTHIDPRALANLRRLPGGDRDGLAA